jgi:uncharacterized MAPEG superfamily protein
MVLTYPPTLPQPHEDALSTPLLCLIGYVLWTLTLLGVVLGHRTLQVLTGKKASNEFPSGIQHGTDAYWRANRAHVNATENLPLFASVVLVGALTSADTEAKFGTLALVTLLARVVQSSVHLMSGSVEAVNVRFTALCVQLGCIAWMALIIVRRAMSLG